MIKGLMGQATKAGGGAVDLVLVRSKNPPFNSRVAMRTPAGEWAVIVPNGDYDVSYFAAGCEPLLHGPYLVDNNSDISTFPAAAGVPLWSENNAALILDPVLQAMQFLMNQETGTKTTTTFGSLSGTGKWIGGVLAPNGKIYGMPRDSTAVLEISVGDHTVPENIGLHRFLNKL